MKFSFSDYKHGGYIELIPEDPKEAAQLLRLTNNAKQEPMSISFNFDSDEPRCTLQFKKIDPKVQENYIHPKSKRK